MSMTELQYSEFQREFAKLLLKHGIRNYAFTMLFFNQEAEAHVPFLFNAHKEDEHGLSRPRVVAVLAEHAVGGSLDTLRWYNGLDLAAASGAIQGMAKSQAHEKSVELMKARVRKEQRMVEA